MTQAALKITETQPTGWREIGSHGWQYAWMNHLTDSGLWATLTGGQQGVLWVLLSRAGTDGTCWPLVPHLVKMSGQKVRSVQSAIKRFKLMGLIQEHPPDQRHAQRYFEFLPWSSWATTEAAHDDAHSESQAHEHAPQQAVAHVHAPPAHTDAPQAHVRAPLAHTGAPLIYRNQNRIDEEESSSSSKSPSNPTAQAAPPSPPSAVPSSEPPQDMLALLDNPTPGLFDEQAAAMMLVDRRFPLEQARDLVARHSIARVLEAIVNCDFRDKRGEIHTNYQAFLAGFLEKGFTLDKRVRAHAEANRRRKHNQQTKAAEQAQLAPARRLSPDARLVAAKGARLLLTQPNATQAQQREHAWQLLQGEEWTRERWQQAVNEMNMA